MESRGWWELDIAGIDPNESTLGHIASLTRNGTTSGEIVQGDSRAEKETQSRGWWELEVTDVDLDDAALEHIADMISGGITSGEIV
jgi:uncharacterized protein YoaH (UPF0181 family)